jgi:hypothetical protein
MDTFCATIVGHISSFFRINAEPLATTCRRHHVEWRTRKFRVMKKYIEQLVEEYQRLSAQGPPALEESYLELALLDFRDGFFD